MSRMVDIVRERMKAHIGCEKKSVFSRQQLRAHARAKSFAEVTKRYGFEPRKARRGIALTLARKAVQRKVEAA